jgi:hypothetical protein
VARTGSADTRRRDWLIRLLRDPAAFRRASRGFDSGITPAGYIRGNGHNPLSTLIELTHYGIGRVEC